MSSYYLVGLGAINVHLIVYKTNLTEAYRPETFKWTNAGKKKTANSLAVGFKTSIHGGEVVHLKLADFLRFVSGARGVRSKMSFGQDSSIMYEKLSV